MDLYIRSQDKRKLTFKPKLYADENGGIFEIIIDDKNDLFLGKYKTKERALEVLEDIDFFKEYMIMYEHQNEEYKDRIRLFLENKGHRLGTYYMPKE